MIRKYFTSDTHFNHPKCIEYCKRPFKDVNIMNEVMIFNWNEKVRDCDYIYIIGDFCLGSKEECEKILKRLKGHKILIIGSHDRTALKCREYFDGVYERLKLKVCGHPTVLDHYCARSWHRSHYNSWLLYGHYHGERKSIGKSHDCGVDCNDFTPISDEEIEMIMKYKKDNPDYILLQHERKKMNERQIISR